MYEIETHNEELVAQLNDSVCFNEYRAPFDNYHTGLVPRILGNRFIGMGNLVYGRKPSYRKFRAIEVIARVPYHSWESAAYTFLTLFYANEVRAIKLSKIAMFARVAQDNETMHVVVVTALAKAENGGGFVAHTLVPVVFAFIYFWIVYLLYLLSPRAALELNYHFEQHAFDQYNEFITEHEEELKRKTVTSAFLDWYGRKAVNQYELFRSIRNDELIHRNRSIREIGMHTR